jgi:predicted RNase H-like nuclease (RuvC/YqgF family)
MSKLSIEQMAKKAKELMESNNYDSIWITQDGTGFREGARAKTYCKENELEGPIKFPVVGNAKEEISTDAKELQIQVTAKDEEIKELTETVEAAKANSDKQVELLQAKDQEIISLKEQLEAANAKIAELEAKKNPSK